MKKALLFIVFVFLSAFGALKTSQYFADKASARTDCLKEVRGEEITYHCSYDYTKDVFFILYSLTAITLYCYVVFLLYDTYIKIQKLWIRSIFDVIAFTLLLFCIILLIFTGFMYGVYY